MALATISPATTPLAPARLSATTTWPQVSCMCWPTARASRSVVPPGANGMTMRICFSGNWPCARPSAGASTVTAKPFRKTLRFIAGVARGRALHGGALEMAHLALLVVAERDVHGATVVPQHDVVLLPLMAIDELGPRRVPHQVVDQRL